MTAAPGSIGPEIIFPSTRRWPAALLGIAVGVAGTIGAATLLDGEADAAADTDDLVVELATAPLAVMDLIEEVEWTGDLIYGDVVDLAAPRDGTVTAGAPVGAILERGDTAFEIDREPVTVLYGSVPAWRDLEEGLEGADVLQLETNLVALGYDPAGTLRVDEEFSAATEAMVERWQEDLGVEATGIVTTGSVVVVPGPVTVTEAPRVGDPTRSGEIVGQMSPRSIVTDIVSATTGEVTYVITPGTAVDDGTVLFTIDGVDTIAILSAEDAPVSDDATEQPFVVVDPDRVVGATSIAVDDVVAEPRPALTLETATRSIVVPVALDLRDDWSNGDAVTVTLPDDTEAAGVVIDVGSVAQGGGQGQAPTVDVTIELRDAVADDLPASEVTVTVAGDQVLGALVAPTRALVSLAEGGFALEKVLDDGTTGLVGIETGAFDDGWVEIVSSTAALGSGDEVVVPR